MFKDIVYLGSVALYYMGHLSLPPHPPPPPPDIS